MKVKVYFENNEWMGNRFNFQVDVVDFFERIKPKENSTIYFIRKIETIDGHRI